ncbi:ATP-dependent Clp protease proteolytic subunit [uncultured Enorma sp.]|uniref:ClpP family protease n=1 Tax=uncultured Enorma sp. TaxID=1714346 RepID=UPI002803B1D5|nr:ATP-dependent Clp protease proteolytic subunit [uncultured Enorma sp.]
MESRIISPCTMRETARGIALTSIYDEMLARRELSVTGQVTSEMAFDICQQLLQLEQADPSAQITLYVASPGGSVSAGLAIVDTMRTISCPVRTVCLDTAASMGAIIFVSGDRREMFPHAELMIHDPLIQNAGGSALSVQETSRRLMGLRRTLSQILADRSGLSVKRVQALTAKDTFLTAERAVELGFSDAIVPSRKAA